MEEFTYVFGFIRAGWRFSACAGLVVLALSWMLPARTLALADPPDPIAPSGSIEEGDINASVTIALELTGADGEGQPVLEIRGRRTRPGNSGPFRVSTRVYRTPCAGEYTLSLAQEDDLNGNTVTYRALVKLLKPDEHPPGAPCGLEPPRRPGHVEIKLRDPERRIFDLDADRSGGGPFNGELTFEAFPGCEDYQLETDLELTGWRRRADFELQVLEFSGSYQGRPIPTQRC
jgi:hypothetical protein